MLIWEGARPTGRRRLIKPASACRTTIPADGANALIEDAIIPAHTMIEFACDDRRWGRVVVFWDGLAWSISRQDWDEAEMAMAA